MPQDYNTQSKGKGKDVDRNMTQEASSAYNEELAGSIIDNQGTDNTSMMDMVDILNILNPLNLSTIEPTKPVKYKHTCIPDLDQVGTQVCTQHLKIEASIPTR
jgi:hypothetical protein